MTKYMPATNQWKIGHHGFPKTLCIVGHLNGQPFTLAQLGEFPNAEEAARLMASAPDLLAALETIAKGEGVYSRDPLEHCSNTIDDMKAIALTAIVKASSSQE